MTACISLLIDVEVSGDALDVIVFFERFDQSQHLRSLCAGQLYVVLRYPADFGGIRSDAIFRQRAADGFKRFGRRQNFPGRAVIPQILGPGIEDNGEHLVFIGLFLGHHDVALALEHPTDGAIFGHVPPCLFIMWRSSLTMRLRLVVTTWTIMPTPPGP